LYIGAINLVYDRKIIHRSQKYGAFQEAVDATARVLQKRFDIFHDLNGLLPDSSINNVHGVRIQGDLTGTK
jgi:hypothetical protein